MLFGVEGSAIAGGFFVCASCLAYKSVLRKLEQGALGIS